MIEIDRLVGPHGLVTLQDWDALPEAERFHVECSEGVLAVTPKPVPQHQWTMVSLTNAINAGTPPDLVAVPDVDVLLVESPLTVRAPDVVVVPRGRLEDNPPRFDAADVLLAVEILSPGTRGTDQVMKRHQYAVAGIEHYWIVDLDEDRPTLTVLRLGNDATYDDVATQRGGTVELSLADATVTVDLDAL